MANPLYNVSFPVTLSLQVNPLPESVLIAGLMNKAAQATEKGNWFHVEVYAAAAWHLAVSCNGHWYDDMAREAQAALNLAQAQQRPVHES